MKFKYFFALIILGIVFAGCEVNEPQSIKNENARFTPIWIKSGNEWHSQPYNYEHCTSRVSVYYEGIQLLEDYTEYCPFRLERVSLKSLVIYTKENPNYNPSFQIIFWSNNN